MQTKLLKDFEPLLSTFKCVDDGIDRYFHEKALEDDDAITYCFLSDDLKTIIALSSLSCNGIIVADHGKFFTYPAIEVKYFAISCQYMHKYVPNSGGFRWSDSCFDLVISQIYEITSLCGASRVFLYSLPRAINFYKRQGMIEFTDIMHGDDRLLNCKPMLMHL